MSEFPSQACFPVEDQPEAGPGPARPQHHPGEAVGAAGGAERGRSPSEATEAAPTASPPPRAPEVSGSPDHGPLTEAAWAEAVEPTAPPSRERDISLDALLRSGERGILPRLSRGHGGRRLAKPEEAQAPARTPEQRARRRPP